MQESTFQPNDGGWRTLVAFRRLGGYRYLLAEEFTIRVGITTRKPLDLPFIRLADGWLTIRRGYAWDGASWPAINTHDFVRGSLVHDALYQLIREGLLEAETHRPIADRLIREICIFDGMPILRAWWVWLAVRLFAAGATRTRIDVRDKVLQAP